MDLNPYGGLITQELDSENEYEIKMKKGNK